MFRFHITTYAGRTRQDNTFRRSRAKFYADNRLRTILRLIEEAHGAGDELRSWIEKTASVVLPKLLGNGHLGGTMLWTACKTCMLSMERKNRINLGLRHSFKAIATFGHIIIAFDIRFRS